VLRVIRGGKNVSIRDLQALRGVLENDVAAMAGLIIMAPLGKVKDRNFRREMAQAGDLGVSGISYVTDMNETGIRGTGIFWSFCPNRNSGLQLKLYQHQGRVGSGLL